MNHDRIGKKIVLLRKEHGYTQEGLAELVGVSPQAISKWENGKALPETTLLPILAKSLHTSIDNLLNQNDFQILSAYYGDGISSTDVTSRLNRLVQNDRLIIDVNEQVLDCQGTEERPAFLIVKYQMGDSISYVFAKEKDQLLIDVATEGITPLVHEEKIRIVAAVYGTRYRFHNVLSKIEHYKFFEWDGYSADQETFPSNPANDGKEYLTLVYLNQNGIHIVTCEEGESLKYTADKCNLFRKRASGEYYLPNVPELPAFGKGNECSWAAALTAALQVMGNAVDYNQVMGVSGACYRLAFCVPDWDYSSVDGLVVYDFAGPAYEAFGYKVCFEERMEKEQRISVRKKIVESISENKPVLAINLRVAPEWGIICGYKESGAELFCRTKYDREIIDSEEYQSDKPNEYDYLYVDNWPFIISYFAEKGDLPAEKENLLKSLQILIDCNKQGTVRGYATGGEAYKVWAEELQQATWYTEHDDESLFRRFSVNQFCVLALCDARRAAASYLASSKQLLPEHSDEITQIASYFEEVSTLADTIKNMVGLEKVVEVAEVRAFWTNEKRNAQADILLKMRELEWKAIQIATEVCDNVPENEVEDYGKK
ncbi:MAG: helix-turn-helix transcriptional regulator [Lachnospiraceae bacterium]|nr:helix-turn-helix transcriptional regulator [Lachnospiraceae bacterium]